VAFCRSQHLLPREFYQVRTNILIASLAIIITTTTACTPRTAAPNPAAPEEAAVRAARADQNRAIAAHDLDRIAEFWTEDVVITAGLGRVLRGRTSYREAFQLDSGMVYERTPDQIHVSAQWPLAFESGRWTGRRGANGPTILGGRYSAQWVQRGGRWLIHSEVFVALTCAGEACQWPMAIS
jgi:ketosteroid isomerase-like protein